MGDAVVEESKSLSPTINRFFCGVAGVVVGESRILDRTASLPVGDDRLSLLIVVDPETMDLTCKRSRNLHIRNNLIL